MCEGLDLRILWVGEKRSAENCGRARQRKWGGSEKWEVGFRFGEGHEEGLVRLGKFLETWLSMNF